MNCNNTKYKGSIISSVHDVTVHFAVAEKCSEFVDGRITVPTVRGNRDVRYLLVLWSREHRHVILDFVVAAPQNNAGVMSESRYLVSGLGLVPSQVVGATGVNGVVKAHVVPVPCSSVKK
jgi:hypothetical protein